MVAIGTMDRLREEVEVLLSDDTLEYDAKQDRVHVTPVKSMLNLVICILKK